MFIVFVLASHLNIGFYSPSLVTFQFDPWFGCGKTRLRPNAGRLLIISAPRRVKSPTPMGLSKKNPRLPTCHQNHWKKIWGYSHFSNNQKKEHLDEYWDQNLVGLDGKHDKHRYLRFDQINGLTLADGGKLCTIFVPSFFGGHL